MKKRNDSVMEKSKKIKPQWRKLAETYLANGFNGAAAAVVAGYSTRRAAQTASEVLNNPLVQAYLDERMKAMQMSANEALMRMSGHASGNLTDFVGLTIEEFKQHPKAWLVKEVTIGVEFPEYNPPYEYIKSVKLHDPQSALNTVIKQHQLASGQPTEIVQMMPTLEKLIELLTKAGKDPASVIGRMVQKLETETGNDA